MKLLTILVATLTLVTVPAWSAKADVAKDLQKLLTTNHCEGCDLSGVNLIGIDLSNAQLQGAKLNAANLSGADLSGANLTKVSAVGISLVGANLQKATLVKASLIYANLAKSQLNDAVLQGTDLQGANLVGADLNGAKITESDFVGANLVDIKRSQPWLANEKNRFAGDVKVTIDSKPTVIEKEVEAAVPIIGIPPSPSITVPNMGTTQDNTQTNTVTGSRNSNVIQGGRGGSNHPDRIDSVGNAGNITIPSNRPVTRGGRDIRIEQRRRPQKVRRRFSIPAWVGFTQTSTIGGDRYHDPDHPDVILELW
jgi:Pentapeptide repeats (8 copies)